MTTLPSFNASHGEEEAQWVEAFEIELKDDTTLNNQLGAPMFKNRTEEEKHTPRELVTEREIGSGRYYFQVRCQRPVYGLFKGRPACLIVLQHAFRTSLTQSRFKYAKVHVRFEDARVVNLDPDDDENEEAFELAQPYRPKILAFQPEDYMRHAPGKPVAEGFIETTLGGSLGEIIPGVSSLSAEVHVTKPVLEEGYHKIQGTIKGECSNRVEWTVGENMLSNSGIVPRFSTPMIVSHTPGRKFAARVRVHAVIKWRPVPTVAGRKDEPLMFASLLSQAEDKVNLEDIDLKSLCKLEGFGGHFIV